MRCWQIMTLMAVLAIGVTIVFTAIALVSSKAFLATLVPLALLGIFVMLFVLPRF